MNSKSKIEITHPPDFLQDRVSLRSEGKMEFTAANSAVDELAEEFAERLPDELKRIEDALTALKEMPDDLARRTALFQLVHALKGQAGTFDYMLITVIGNDLCRFLELSIPMAPRCLKVIHLHVGAMNRVAEEHMTGERDESGLHMINTLHSMTRKVLME